MKKKKIYIAGCGGMLGDAFYNVFSNSYELKCTDIDLNEPWLNYLDFRDYETYFSDVSEFGPDYLFHLGAFTNLEYCEANQDEAYATNTLSVENAAHIANILNIPILYISTAGIFDGTQDTYDDWDLPNPLGCYGRSKYAGELFIQQNCQRHLILRAGWMMGAGPNKDKKFIQKIMKQLKDGSKDLYIVDDKLGTPTYTYDFAANVKLLIDKEFWGLYNMVCRGITGRAEVTKELLNILDLKNEVNINLVGSDYWKKEYFSERPMSERLINKKLDIHGLNIMRDWKICLKEYIGDFYHNYL